MLNLETIARRMLDVWDAPDARADNITARMSPVIEDVRRALSLQTKEVQKNG